MELTTIQSEMLQLLRSAVRASSRHQFVYCCECLGYLPYGYYHWIEVETHDTSRAFLIDWSRSDLDALEKFGVIKKISSWQDPDDEFEGKITFELLEFTAEQIAAMARQT